MHVDLCNGRKTTVVVVVVYFCKQPDISADVPLTQVDLYNGRKTGG